MPNEGRNTRRRWWIALVVALVIIALTVVAYFLWVKPSKVNLTHKAFITKVENGVNLVSVPAGAEMYKPSSEWTAAEVVAMVIREDSMDEKFERTYFLDNYSLFFGKEEFAKAIDSGESSFFIPYNAIFPTTYGKVYMFYKNGTVLFAVERSNVPVPAATENP